MAARVWVVGSLNADLVIPAARLPAWGETLAGGGELRTLAGGKGANQACAASRLGAPSVVMIGNTGDDSLGRFLASELARAGVDTSLVHPVPGVSTGCALIAVRPDDGANAILLSPGANATLTAAQVEARLTPIQPGDFLLCQLETPPDTVLAALRLARRRGATSILDPAPAGPATPEILAAAGIVTPNESEAASILATGQDESAHPRESARRLRQQAGVPNVLLKLGARGAFWLDRSGHAETVPAFAVNAVDTTAAGDTFNGGFAAARARGRTIAASLRFASAAAALSVTRPGAQASIPDAAEVEAFLALRPC